MLAGKALRNQDYDKYVSVNQSHSPKTIWDSDKQGNPKMFKLLQNIGSKKQRINFYQNVF